MRKILFLVFIIAGLLLAGCVEEQNADFCGKTGTDNKMSLDTAREIANSSECVADGQLKESGFCNTSSGTWWIDLDVEKPGCNPACVVDVETEEVEINWRCTGAIATKEKIGPVAEKIVFKKIAPENAVENIVSGEIDYYLESIKTKENDPQIQKVDLVNVSSTINGILLNPAPSLENKFNPFSSQKARFALQFLLDRDSIAENAHNKFGNAAVINIFANHPMYEKSLEAAEKLSIEFNPEKGEELLAEAMQEQGAEKVDGKWMFDGEPVSLKMFSVNFIEEMKDIGDSVAETLEETGFEIEIIYQSRDDENPAYYSDPAGLEWSITPTSWIYYGIGRYITPSFSELYEKDGWWAHENSEKSLLNKKLTEESFDNAEEWEEIVWELVNVDLEDSVGIWISHQQNVFAKNPALQNVTEDNFVGLRNYLNVRKAGMPDSDTIKIGMSETHIANESWNPAVIMGINIMDIINTLHDPILWANPKSLETEGFRWNFEIESAGETEISVPEKSFVWNPENKKWDNVADGTTARTKVSYNLSNYIDSKWHHGIEIGWSDILFFTAAQWDMAFDKEKITTDDVGKRRQDMFNEIKGIRINGNTLDVYLNKSSFEADQLTSFAGMFRWIAPWEIYAGTDKLVFEDKTFRYTKATNDEIDIEPLSLVKEEHCLELIAAIKAIDAQNIKPMFEAGGKDYSSAQELSERTTVLENWFAQKGHLIINDGPFYLERFDPTTSEMELRAFRDNNYPINWETWGEELLVGN